MLRWLGLVALLMASSSISLASEETFPVLQIGTKVYTNATITTKAKTYVFVMHSAGMETVKIQDLPREVQQKLGYLPPDVPQKSGEVAAPGLPTPAGVAGSARNGLGALVEWIKGTGAKLKTLNNKAALEKFKEDLQAESKKVGPDLRSLDPRIVYIALGIIVFSYLFFCYCGRLICVKAGADPGILIWLPLFQFIPLFRAADMSPAWFLALFVPLLNIVAQIMWCFKIAKARNKSIGVGILLLLPLLNILAFCYLAFADSVPVKEEKKLGSRTLVLGAT
jgi:hypothetical protein